jgi:hypothetical protein
LILLLQWYQILQKDIFNLMHLISTGKVCNLHLNMGIEYLHLLLLCGARGGALVEALGCKPEVRGNCS